MDLAKLPKPAGFLPFFCRQVSGVFLNVVSGRTERRPRLVVENSCTINFVTLYIGPGVFFSIISIENIGVMRKLQVL